MLTFGSGSKNGAIHSNTSNSKPHDINDVSCVFPPTVCCMMDRDIDAVNGIHEKKDPTILPAPYRKHISGP